MISIDTNIFLYAIDSKSDAHDKAFEFVSSHLTNESVLISEFVLMEIYVLLRNPALFKVPLSAQLAAESIAQLRTNPHWTISKGTIDVSEQVWREAGKAQFPRRAIFDARLAHSLAAEGVKRFATRNVADFERFSLFEVFDPLLFSPWDAT
jgi:toxin-antitoxin system PIN domain toxin